MFLPKFWPDSGTVRISVVLPVEIQLSIFSFVADELSQSRIGDIVGDEPVVCYLNEVSSRVKYLIKKNYHCQWCICHLCPSVDTGEVHWESWLSVYNLPDCQDTTPLLVLSCSPSQCRGRLAGLPLSLWWSCIWWQSTTRSISGGILRSLRSRHNASSWNIHVALS